MHSFRVWMKSTAKSRSKWHFTLSRNIDLIHWLTAAPFSNNMCHWQRVKNGFRKWKQPSFWKNYWWKIWRCLWRHLGIESGVRVLWQGGGPQPIHHHSTCLTWSSSCGESTLSCPDVALSGEALMIRGRWSPEEISDLQIDLMKEEHCVKTSPVHEKFLVPTLSNFRGIGWWLQV